jgi:hypothetical protein
MLIPLVISAVLRRQGGLLTEEELERIDEDMELGIREPQL